METTSKSGTSLEKRGDPIDRRVCVAPMMDWTDRHCRYFLRLFAPSALLYTEMIHAAAILRGDAARLLGHSAEEQPLALQLGGSDPQQLAAAARRGEEAGYREVNLNCGCPSERVQAGAFGACLMGAPALVADCVAAMKQAVRVPVTVKFRIGIVDRAAEGGTAAAVAAAERFDELDRAALESFAGLLRAAGTDVLIVHARKAVLGGLSPHENRTVPPLRFDVVAQLRAALPGVPVVVNGGVRTREAALDALERFDGVMIGREAYHRPALLAEIEAALQPDGFTPPGTMDVLGHMREYATGQVARGVPLQAITRHMLGLMSGQPGAKALRQVLSRDVVAGAGVGEVFRRAAEVAGAACFP